MMTIEGAKDVLRSKQDKVPHFAKDSDYNAALEIAIRSLDAWISVDDVLHEKLQADPRKNVCDNTPVPYFDGIYDALKVVKRYMFKIEGKEGVEWP